MVIIIIIENKMDYFKSESSLITKVIPVLILQRNTFIGNTVSVEEMAFEDIMFLILIAAIEISLMLTGTKSRTKQRLL